MESLTDIESVIAILGLDADPKAINCVHMSIGHSRSVAYGAPCSALSVDQAVPDVHRVVVITSALIPRLSSLVNSGEIGDEVNCILLNAITL
jgi:hypothetical protein